MAKRQHAVKREDPTARTPAGDAFSALAIHVMRLGALLTDAGDALAAPHGQTSARWQVLAGAEDAPTTVAEIARRLGLARQSVQRVADLLASEGLAAYDENPSHQRAQLLRLTPRGRSTLAAIQRAQRAWADDLGASLGASELRRATKVLAAITERVRSTTT